MADNDFMNTRSKGLALGGGKIRQENSHNDQSKTKKGFHHLAVCILRADFCRAFEARVALQESQINVPGRAVALFGNK
jgi:hypothetical protein